jgi:hypothetical protein
MPDSILSLGLELGLAILLAAVLFVCWRLERKLAALRAGQDGIREAVQELREASVHAENAVRSLRATANETGRDLQARIDDARSVANGLGLNLSRARPAAEPPRRAGQKW